MYPTKVVGVPITCLAKPTWQPGPALPAAKNHDFSNFQKIANDFAVWDMGRGNTFRHIKHHFGQLWLGFRIFDFFRFWSIFDCRISVPLKAILVFFFQKIEKSVRILTQKLVQKSSKNGFLHKILSRTDFFFWGVFERFGANKHHFGHFFQIPTWEMIFRGRISGKIWNVLGFPAYIEVLLYMGWKPVLVWYISDFSRNSSTKNHFPCRNLKKVAKMVFICTKSLKNTPKKKIGSA